MIKVTMKLLQYPQLMFRIFGILPLNGVDFNTYKCVEILRMCLFPVPTFVTCFTMFAFFLIHILDIGKSTDALFAVIGFLNAALIYSMLMYNKRELLGLMNELQILLDRSKEEKLRFFCHMIFHNRYSLGCSLNSRDAIGQWPFVCTG